MTTGARASRSKCTASRVPVNPAPTMAIRGVEVTGARIVRDACMVRSEAYPFSRRDSRSGVRAGAPAPHRRGIARSAVRDIGPDDIPPCADLGPWHESPPGGRVLRVDATHVPAAGSAFDLLPIDGC